MTIFNSKATTYKNIPLRFSINSLKYAQLGTLVLKTILVLIKFPFQWYISCRHLNFDPTYKTGLHGDFLLFWNSRILRLVDDLVVPTKISKSKGHIRTWNKNFFWAQKFLRDSILGLELLNDNTKNLVLFIMIIFYALYIWNSFHAWLAVILTILKNKFYFTFTLLPISLFVPLSKRSLNFYQSKSVHVSHFMYCRNFFVIIILKWLIVFASL